MKKLVKSGLPPETIRKYVEYVKKVMSSKLAPNGEPLYPRIWNATVMDLPLVVYSKQKGPRSKPKASVLSSTRLNLMERSTFTCCSQPPE